MNRGQTSVTSMVVLKSSVTSPMIPMSDVESSGGRSLMIVGQTSVTSMVVLKSSGTSPMIPMSDVEFSGGRPDESRTNVSNVDVRLEIIGDFPDSSMSDVEYLGVVSMNRGRMPILRVITEDKVR